MSYRGHYLCQGWNDLDYQAYCIGASFHHLLTQIKPQQTIIKAQNISNVPHLRIKTNRYQGNSLGRLVNMFTYTYRLWSHHKAIANITNVPDVIIASSPHPFTFIVAAKLAKHYKAKFICDIQDLWPLSLIEILQISHYHPLIKLMSWAEQYGYKNADHIVTVMANGLTYLKKFGINATKFSYIPNGIDINTPTSQEPLPEAVSFQMETLRKQDKFVIGYVGAQGIPNALEQLIEAMSLLHIKHPNIHCVIVGQGHEKQNLISKTKNLTNTTFIDPIDKNAVQTLLSYVDTCYIGWKNLPLYHYGISANKIFDYMLAGKPIIHAIHTQYDPIAEAKCGIIVPPEQPQKLVEAILTLFNTPLDERQRMGQLGLAFVKKHHDYNYLSKQYAQLF